jgi:hypothetical protein
MKSPLSLVQVAAWGAAAAPVWLLGVMLAAEPPTSTSASPSSQDEARAGLADHVEQVLQQTQSASASEQRRVLQPLVARLLHETQNNYLVQEALERAQREATEAAQDGPAAESLRAGLESTREILAFRPLLEAKQPAGFPSPGALGEVQLKSYPSYRMARTAMDRSDNDPRAFFTLFNHISQNNIEMTAPVEMTYQTEQGKLAGESMAFLYEDPRLGETGKQDRVEVRDVPPKTVVSVGIRGNDSVRQIAAARAQLERWLELHQEQYQVDGPVRVLGYNSPMVPAARRFAEVQIPVRKRSPQ